MKRIFTFVLIILFVTYVGSFQTFAQTGVAKLIKTGIQYYHDADFDKAVSTLEKSLKFGLSKSQQIQVHLYIGISNLALTKSEKAKKHFAEIFKLDPNYTLKEGEFPAEVINIIKESQVGMKVSPKATPQEKKISTSRQKRELIFKSGVSLFGYVVTYSSESIVFQTEEVGKLTIQIPKIKQIIPPLKGLRFPSDPVIEKKVEKKEPLKKRGKRNFIEKTANKSPKKKVKIPHYLVAAAVVIIAIAALLILSKKETEIESEPENKLYHLTVEKSEGTDGYPISSQNYNAGETVQYDYKLKGGYTNLQVFLDGIAVNSSGSFVMDKDRALRATTGIESKKSKRYTFAVNNERVSDGTPVEFSQNIGLSGYIQEVRYYVKMTDNDISDLAIDLISPAGTSFSILSKNSGTGSGYSKSGTTHSFDKEQISGAWKMRIDDGTTEDTVRFGTWWIEFTYSTVITSSQTYYFAAPSPGRVQQKRPESVPLNDLKRK